ncbi:hypothetical protein JCM10213_008876 [Rhodosporidiobolus nylandii]
MLLLPLLALVALAAAERTITVVNQCNFTIWPAVAGTFPNSGYNDARGWEAAPGNSKTVTIPEGWNGRGLVAAAPSMLPVPGLAWREIVLLGGTALMIRWATADSNPTGQANLLEINLNQYGGNDFWDISAVPGFVAPMAVTPSVSSCTSVSCATSLNPTCPDDRLKIHDTDGTVIGCLSACMAHIWGVGGAADNSVNCCSGTYSADGACDENQVDFYKFFKDGCTNAYAYPRDDQAHLPPVVFTCPAAQAPSYTVTFCPSTASVTTGMLAEAVNADGSAPADQLLNMSRPLAFTLLALIAILFLALIAILFCLGRLHRQDKLRVAHEDEAHLALSQANALGKYRDESEEELPRKGRGRRSSRA